jgi:hypothetical protein
MISEFENVIFFQDEAAEEALSILNRDGEDAALAHLAQWHYPGEHETRTGDAGFGTDDDVYEKDGYILSWNSRVGYIGLSYRIGESCEICGIGPAEEIPDNGFSRILCERCARKETPYLFSY